jgi:preprotein translocase subunit SecG
MHLWYNQLCEQGFRISGFPFDQLTIRCAMSIVFLMLDVYSLQEFYCRTDITDFFEAVKQLQVCILGSDFRVLCILFIQSFNTSESNFWRKLDSGPRTERFTQLSEEFFETRKENRMVYYQIYIASVFLFYINCLILKNAESKQENYSETKEEASSNEQTWHLITIKRFVDFAKCDFYNDKSFICGICLTNFDPDNRVV